MIYMLCQQQLWKFGHQILRQSTSASVLVHNSTAVTAPENAKDIIEQQLKFDVKLPKAKTWSDTAVLQALANTVESDVNVSYQHLESPLYWHSGNFYSESKRHDLRMRGRTTANYVIDNYGHLFQHEWSADSIDTWINLENEEVPMLSLQEESSTETEESPSDMNQIDTFRKFLDQKKISAALQMYLRLIREDVDLPQDLMNQFLGFCAYYKASSTQVALLEIDPSRATSMFKCRDMGPAESSKHIAELYQTLPDLTVDQISAKLLSYTNTTRNDCSTVVSIYKTEVKENMKLDVAVYNHVLLCLKHAHSISSWMMSKEVLATMRKHKVKPNYETFLIYLQTMHHSFNDSVQLMLDHFTKVLLEMKELDIEPGLSIFASMLSTASQVKNPYRNRAMYAVLNYMEGKQFRLLHPLDVTAFYRMVGNCRRDLGLMKKLLRISQHGSNEMILSSNAMKSFSFYMTILDGLLEKDTLENSFYYLQKLAPARITVNMEFLGRMIARVLKEKRPEFLPVIVLYFRPSKYYVQFEQWLQAAIQLLSCADDDTKIQFRHIAMIELRNTHKLQYERMLNDVINSSLSLLISTADSFQDVAAIVEVLMKLRKKVTIDETILDQFKKLGVEKNRSVQADRVIAAWRKKIS